MVIVGPLALLVALTVRDRWPLVSTFFYATPPALVVAGGCAGAILAGRRKRRSLTLGNVALAALALWAHVATAHFAHAAAEPAERRPIRGVFWNIQRGRGGWEGVARKIADQEPDIVLLVEPGRRREGADAVIAAALPGYQRLRARRKVLAFARGEGSLEGSHSLADRGMASVLRLIVRGRRLNAVVADLPSNPWRQRGPILDSLAALAAPLSEEPTLVVGDFNTPRRSAHLDDWRTDWTHAFEAAGNGFDGTWPTWFPVLSIDHVWASRTLEITHCELLASWASDHRMVVFEIR